MKTKTENHTKPARGGRLAAAIRITTQPGKIHEGHGPLKLKRILVPLDFSDHSMKALHYAAAFAGQFGANLTLLHVVQPIAYPAEPGYSALEVPVVIEETLRKDAAAKLSALGGELQEINVKSLVRTGQPYYEITTAARELGVDLIIIATHGYTGLKHAFLGSTAERVVRHAPCPVLTVREREHEFA